MISDASHLGCWARSGGRESWLFTFTFNRSKFNWFFSSALLSSLWKHLKGENNTKKHRNLFSSLQAFVTAPVPKCTNFWPSGITLICFSQGSQRKDKQRTCDFRRSKGSQELMRQLIFFSFLAKREGVSVKRNHLVSGF